MQKTKTTETGAVELTGDAVSPIDPAVLATWNEQHALETLGSEEVGNPAIKTDYHPGASWGHEPAPEPAPTPEPAKKENPRDTLAGYIKDGVIYWDKAEKCLCITAFTGVRTDGEPSHVTIPLHKIGCFSPSVVSEANKKNDPLADTRKRLKRLEKSGVSPEMLRLALEEVGGNNGKQ
jgi:hypothetical protein